MADSSPYDTGMSFQTGMAFRENHDADISDDRGGAGDRG
jgi:hypothetical protein